MMSLMTTFQPDLARAVVQRAWDSVHARLLQGLRLLVALTLLLGLAYPLVVLGFGQVAAPWQARGSLVTADGSHTTTDLIMVYVVHDDGRVASMKAYWEPDRTMASFTPAS